MKKIIFILIMTAVPLYVLSQEAMTMAGKVTYYPKVKYQNTKYKINKVVITDDETIVVIEVPINYKTKFVRFSSATVLVPQKEGMIDIDLTSPQEIEENSIIPKKTLNSPAYIGAYNARMLWIFDEKEKLKEKGFLIKSLGTNKLDTKYSTNQRKLSTWYFHLHFNRLPHGVNNVYIRELVDGGKYWEEIEIENP